MNLETQNSEIENFIANTSEASSRSRRFLIILCFTSLVAFISYHNSRQDSWDVQRYNKLMRYNKIFKYVAKTDTIDRLYNNETDKLDSKRVDTLLKTDADRAKVKEALDFCNKRDITTQKEFDDLKGIYLDIKKHSLTVNISILGLNIDINDLGLFAGLTFSFVLLIFLFCLAREEDSLNYTLSVIFSRKGRDSLKQIEYYYDRLSMGQVLTIPPKSKNISYSFFLIFSKIPYFTAFITQTLIYVYDVNTRDYGTTINPSTTNSDEVISLIMLIVVLILTLISFSYGIKIDLVWYKYYTMLNERIKGHTSE